MHWVVVGCGYTGTRLARTLVERGDRVTITRRDPDELARLAAELGVTPLRLELGEPAALPTDAIVVCLAPPGITPASEIRTLLPTKRLVYISSTGVYAPANGDLVDEAWTIEPATPSGRARAAAERVAQTHESSVVLRAAGIYGPGTGIIDRIRGGNYRIVGDGTAHISRIHVDDLVAAIIAAGESSAIGPINIADDDPAPIGRVADAIAAHLGLPPPPRVPESSVPAEIAGMLTANRRISNTRMKRDLGVVLRYPSWRDSIAAAPAADSGRCDLCGAELVGTSCSRYQCDNY